MEHVPKERTAEFLNTHRIVVRAADVAEDIICQAKDSLAQVQQAGGRQPTMLGLLANDDPATLAYAKWTRKVLEANGCRFRLQGTPGHCLESKITEANKDDEVDGILVYYPVHNKGQVDDRYYQRLVSPDKDVGGLCSEHMHALYHEYLQLGLNPRRQAILPCTALAVFHILEIAGVCSASSCGERLSGRTITVVNRSEVVGKPLAALLVSEGATVFSIDQSGAQILRRESNNSGRRYRVTDLPGCELEDFLGVSDVILSGVHDREFKIRTEMVREGAVCVDFSSAQNFEKTTIVFRASVYATSIGKVVVAALFGNFTVRKAA